MLFEHGAGSGDDTEVRAAVLESEYGKGLYYASAAVKGRPIAFYDGVVVSEEEYHRLNEETGLSHTLQTKTCLLYTSPSPRDTILSRMPSSA